jgi:hypothetical protein
MSDEISLWWLQMSTFLIASADLRHGFFARSAVRAR